jgi:hypothetical protein
MSSRSLSSDLAPAPSLFYRARQLELQSMARRAEAHIERLKFHSLCDCASPVFHLSATGSGCWEIREQNGTKAGVFRTRQAAIKFARDESPNGNFVIIDALEPAE